MKALAPNTMIQNRYLVVQAIGKGGMGEVYLAVDQRLGSAVALKRTFFSDDSALGSAFEREARILARLRHPVLPKVIDHFAEGGDQFLVMEHISGDDIAKRLETANKPFPLSWVMFWADQMLDALSYLHSHEPAIVHRDIKPQNLKLTDENHIVLLDFGLSKDFDSSATGNPLNSASVAGYSPHFASMEQIRGTGTDARSDIYSLSATLYQMLTNVIPSDALTRADALLGGAADSIKPLNELNPDITPAVSDVILRGIALRQEARFQTAGEMQKALRRAYNKGNTELDAKTLVLSPDADPSAPGPTTNPSEMDTRAAVGNEGLSDTGRLAMEATVQMSMPSIEDSMQSDVKTAVFTAPVEPEPVAVEPEPEMEQATQLRPPVAAAAAAGATPTPFQQPVVNTQPPVHAAAVPKKKSKTGLVVGLLIGLLVIAGIAAGGGWYAFNKYSAGAKPVTTPTPAQTAAPTASPVPTENVVADSNKNANTSNSQVSDANTADPNSSKNPTKPTTTTADTTKTAPTKAAPVNPATKATPKAKKPDERTVILQ